MEVTYLFKPNQEESLFTMHVGMQDTSQSVTQVIDRKEKLAAMQMSFKEFRDEYIVQLRNGGRATYKGTNYKKSSMESVCVILNRLRDYENERGRNVDFDDVNMSFYRDFISFLKLRGYSVNSLGKAVKILKTVMHRAEDEGYHNNRCYDTSSFKVLRSDTDSVYLTAEELKKINALDLTGSRAHLQVSRDIFMIGVWSAQRVSDYNYLNISDVRDENCFLWNEDGQMSDYKIKTIHIVQKKTGKKLIIPCNRALRGILDRYPDKLPHISEQALNRNIKKIGKLAGIDEPIEIRITKGGELSVRTYKKYELLSSHTARRTGATLMYLSGMSVYDICKITGHSNIKTLESYIKADELETIKKITERYDYFK